MEKPSKPATVAKAPADEVAAVQRNQAEALRTAGTVPMIQATQPVPAPGATSSGTTASSTTPSSSPPVKAEQAPPELPKFDRETFRKELEAVNRFLPEKGFWRQFNKNELEGLELVGPPFLNRYTPWLATHHPEAFAFGIVFGGIAIGRAVEVRREKLAEEEKKKEAEKPRPQGEPGTEAKRVA